MVNEGEEPRYDDKAESKRLGQFHLSIPAEYGIRYVCFSLTRLCADGNAYYRYRAHDPTHSQVDVTSGSCCCCCCCWSTWSPTRVPWLLLTPMRGSHRLRLVSVRTWHKPCRTSTFLSLSLFYRVEKCIKGLNERQSHYFDGFSDKIKDLTMVSYRPSRWVFFFLRKIVKHP